MYLRKVIASVAFLCNLLAAILFIFAAYSDRISPVTSVLPAYLGLAFPILFVFNCGFVLFWLVQKSKYLLISTVAIILSLGSLWDYTPLHLGRDKSSGHELTLLTYNVFNMGGYRPDTKEKPNKTLQYLRESDADIICLQEFGVGKKRDDLISMRDVRKTLKAYPYYSFTVKNEDKYTKSGTAVFSKYPLKKKDQLNFGSSYNGATIFEVKVGKEVITLINCHLESNKFTEDDKQLYSYMIKNFEPDLLSEVKIRLVEKLGKAFKLRSYQADRLAEIIKSKEGRIIVCGDFNDTPQSYVYHTVKGNLDDAYVKTGFGPGITYNANRFWFRIDHVLYGKGLKAVKSTIDKVRYSDHYPLKVVFDFEP